MKDGTGPTNGEPAPLSQTGSMPGVRLASDVAEAQHEVLNPSITDLFERQVLQTPDRLAVRSRRHEFSYAALNETANQIAHAVLAERGEGEEPIALLFEQGAPVIAAILGVLKAGKIYVPLEPNNPRTRNEHIRSDSTARLIVADTESLPLARELATNGVSVIHAADIAPSTSARNPGLRLSPNTLANILYTSGSTGRPKGVIQDHRHLLDEVRLHTRDLRIVPADRICLDHSTSFSASIRRIFPALLSGAALFPLNTRKEGVRALPGWLAQEAITIAGGRHLLQKCQDALTDSGQFPHLRLLTFGGDMTYRSDVEKYRQYLPDNCLMVVNLASTEAGTITRFFLDKQTEFMGGVVPVGYPVDGKQVRLLDESGGQVAPGEVGEIEVQGRALFRGYWQRPDLTQAALQPGPDGNGWRFRTGDMGRMLADGCLMHLGRKDFQVKVQGYRVETAEVEMALREVVAVREAVVMAQRDRAGDSRLVAYLVPSDEPLPSVSSLRRSLTTRLPEYMVPSAYVVLEALPRTATGKVDRMALPIPARARPPLDSSFAPPRTPVEKALVELWADVLDLDTVGIHDPFMELGGNSLRATRVIARLRELLAVELPLRSFFEHPTVAELAVVIAQQLAERTAPDEILELMAELEQLTEAELQSRSAAPPP